jgi:hypothetical protein
VAPPADRNAACDAGRGLAGMGSGGAIRRGRQVRR